MEQDGVEQMKRWQRVSIDASGEDGITIIRITRGRKGDAMATLESLKWFELDSHKYTGYAPAQETGRRPAVEVLDELKRCGQSLRLRATTFGIRHGVTCCQSAVNRVRQKCAQHAAEVASGGAAGSYAS